MRLRLSEGDKRVLKQARELIATLTTADLANVAPPRERTITKRGRAGAPPKVTRASGPPIDYNAVDLYLDLKAELTGRIRNASHLERVYVLYHKLRSVVNY